MLRRLAITIFALLVLSGIFYFQYGKEEKSTRMNTKEQNVKIFFFLFGEIAATIPTMQMPPKGIADAVLSYDPGSSSKIRVEAKDTELKAHIEKIVSLYINNPDAVKNPTKHGFQATPESVGISIGGESVSIDEGPAYYLYNIAGDIRWKYQNEDYQFNGKYLVSFADEVE